ncbi:type II toxin-antitoxin system HigB family toxin [Dyadobacter sp. CY261]|uniref:type II toxin-antitoxin system HigB family toxin n=1 Tax=Dyadobacter sp. CY261 TaxID=2907203 RepID=UPI001F21F6AC|nr:type II toxin-antitoxin system HigB family toxin [Dyadobacter sp. CY261]MCF0073952.1 type II toxin-antitoxin system HigB family toxin [Dyadobacter sp. CY261]
MVVVSRRAIRSFCTHSPELETALDKWYKESRKADWASFSALRQTFNATDSVGNGLFVFNIGGNKCRLVARIFFRKRTLYIRFIGTHKQYDELDLSTL